jgi:cell division protein FtsZ
MEEKNFSELDNFEAAARIVVIGVGGAGNNAVNRMIDDEINAIDFWVANTDKQALSTSKARRRLILGNKTTAGLGAGGNPEVGRQAAEESIEDIRAIVKGANMVFIAAGMGGGTGTGASLSLPHRQGRRVLDRRHRHRPFTFEGKRRIANSVAGLTELKNRRQHDNRQQ